MLELVDVSKVQEGQVHIHPTSLTLQRGSLNVLLGPTLSGKTTLLRLMAGLEKPTTGSVRFDGKDVTGVAVQKRNVAMVYQQFINYPAMTVYENIASPLRVAGEASAVIDTEVKKVAELMRLTPFLERQPLSLSGGQQQRLCIARGIAIKPEVLLLDEPCSALDPISTAKVEELIVELKQDYTVVIVTHNMQQAARCSDYTAYMYLGDLIEFGATEQMFFKPTRKETEDYITGRFG